jgi:hypothetical protein
MFVSSVWVPWPSRACFMALLMFVGLWTQGPQDFRLYRFGDRYLCRYHFWGDEGMNMSMDPSYFQVCVVQGILTQNVELITTIHLLVVPIFHVLVLRPNRSPHENGPKFLGTLRVIKRGNRKSSKIQMMFPAKPPFYTSLSRISSCHVGFQLRLWVRPEGMSRRKVNL